MVRHKTAEAEIDEIINEADKERRARGATPWRVAKNRLAQAKNACIPGHAALETMVAARTPQSALIGSDL